MWLTVSLPVCSLFKYDQWKVHPQHQEQTYWHSGIGLQKAASHRVLTKLRSIKAEFFIFSCSVKGAIGKNWIYCNPKVALTCQQTLGNHHWKQGSGFFCPFYFILLFSFKIPTFYCLRPLVFKTRFLWHFFNHFCLILYPFTLFYFSLCRRFCDFSLS